ncbi:MAG: cob(I)yrinic acid a,c-diamide adenosyltransferase [Prevotella sp.]|jgi:cob(I)alamin adenosyltransferase
MLKIYTKTGDKGTTQLSSGERVDKDDAQVEAVGTIDELNANIGLLMTDISDEALLKRLHELQTEMFNIGGNLPVDEELTKKLEEEMDKMTAELPRIKDFIYPGGCRAAAQCHVCRTICRRAERRFVSLAKIRPVDASILRFLNRLSDYFFVLARKLNFVYNVSEKTW